MHIALALFAIATARALPLPDSGAPDNATYTKFDRATADRLEARLDVAKAEIEANATCWKCFEPLTAAPPLHGMDIRAPTFLANTTACARTFTGRFLSACDDECSELESAFLEANEAVCGLLLMELLYYEEYGE